VVASSNEITFALGGAVRRASVPPTTTVLEWLRGQGRIGTKEGCAEGDCGACTVALGEKDGAGRTIWRAVNSCILFMPAVAGKELVTVEDLKASDGTLHPAQQAMVEAHASQCGFCTPGFVMSLFCLYHAHAATPDDETIHDALAGNLCRCTGYRPIVEAARRMHGLGETKSFNHERPPLLPPRKSLAELDAEIAATPNATLVAGATDIGLWVTKSNQRLRPIFLGVVEELQTIRESDGALELGGGVTYAAALPHIERHWPSFGELIRRLGSEPIRNSGTIGGNIANASPIGDTPPALLALGATLVLRRAGTNRELPLDEFFLAYRKTALLPGEIIERIRIPIDPKFTFATWKISKRRDQDISAVVGGFAVKLAEGRVAEARLAYGGMAATPKRAAAAEAALLGKSWCEETIRAAMNALARDFRPIDDMRASSRYRLLVAQNLLLRFFHG
jgi:xanthine dehydrogenase small subunit